MKRARIRLAYTLDHHSAVVGFRMVGNPACADLCRGALSDERPYRELHQDDRQGLSGLDRIPVLESGQVGISMGTVIFAKNLSIRGNFATANCTKMTAKE
jgi:hypothetical protein